MRFFPAFPAFPAFPTIRPGGDRHRLISLSSMLQRRPLLMGKAPVKMAYGFLTFGICFESMDFSFEFVEIFQSFKVSSGLSGFLGMLKIILNIFRIDRYLVWFFGLIWDFKIWDFGIYFVSNRIFEGFIFVSGVCFYFWDLMWLFGFLFWVS